MNETIPPINRVPGTGRAVYVHEIGNWCVPPASGEPMNLGAVVDRDKARSFSKTKAKGKS